MSSVFKLDQRSEYERINSGVLELDDDHKDFMEYEQFKDSMEEKKHE